MIRFGGVRQLVQQLVEAQAEMESGMIVDPPRDDDEKPIKQAAPPPKRLSIYEGEAPDGTRTMIMSYVLDAPTAVMLIGCRQGVPWKGFAVRSQREDFSLPKGVISEWVPCVKVERK